MAKRRKKSGSRRKATRRPKSRLRKAVNRLRPKKIRIGASTTKGLYGEAEW